jgi:hypothetical protein
VVLASLPVLVIAVIIDYHALALLAHSHSATGLPPAGPPARYLRSVASENRPGKVRKNGDKYDKYGERTYEANDDE